MVESRTGDSDLMALVRAIVTGDSTNALRLLGESPGLASTRFAGASGRGTFDGYGRERRDSLASAPGLKATGGAPVTSPSRKWVVVLYRDSRLDRAGRRCSPCSDGGRIERMTPARWHEDLLVLAHEIASRHRNPFHHVSKPAFDEAVAALDMRIPTLRDYEVVVGLQSIAATIGDGHTRLDTSRIYHHFPLEVDWFGHELRVIRTIGAYERMLGARIVSIGGWRIGVVLERLGRLIPQAENEWFVLHNSARQMVSAEPLAALGIVTELGTAPFSFEDDDGARFVLQLESAPHDARLDWVDLWPEKPLHLRWRDTALWSTFLADTRTVYASFRRYEGLGENARMLWECVDSNPVDRLVIDMRHNGGGNYVHGHEYLVYEAQRRQSVNRAGRLCVVTGRATFSAAMTNATDFRRETEALLVGEPPGARPNGYRELSRFTLPNSKLEASCSMLRYRFQDEDAPFVMPVTVGRLDINRAPPRRNDAQFMSAV